jgi:hypothetical protein
MLSRTVATGFTADLRVGPCCECGGYSIECGPCDFVSWHIDDRDSLLNLIERHSPHVGRWT